ncbi:MAG: DUF3237 domain-containing protein [Caldilineaceae bacterium]|nr:DUF3237 domain-containing protein [Caldilineaceae bacterium]
MISRKKLLVQWMLVALLLSACSPVILPVPVLVPAEQPDTPAATTSATTTHNMQDTPLFNVTIDLEIPRDIGSGSLGSRYVSYFKGGTIDGHNLEGKILPDGEIWYLIRSKDCIAELIIQGILQTDDGAQIAFVARGFSGVGPTTMELVAQGQLVNPADTLFRGVTFFRTEAQQYAWMNHVTTISTYQYNMDQLHLVVYQLHP